MAEENPQNAQENEETPLPKPPEPAGTDGSPPTAEDDPELTVESAGDMEGEPLTDEPPLPEPEPTADTTEQDLPPQAVAEPQTAFVPVPRVAVVADTIPVLPVAILLIGLGIILVWPVISGGYILLPEIIVAILVAGLALSLLAYWLKSGRQARGALFVALTGLLTAGLTGLFALLPETITISTDWPLYVAGAGIAILLTYVVDPARSLRFLTPALVLIAAGLIAFPVTRQIIPESVMAMIRQGWPWIFGVLVLGLLPIAFRRVSGSS